MPTKSRLTRLEQVERNRSLVLDAAEDVFRTNGYAAATLEQVAERAGFSRGVTYSQFAHKADLFLSMLERRRDVRADANRRVVAQADDVSSWRPFVRFLVEMAASEPDWNLLNTEFRSTAAREPEVRARYAALHAVTVAELATALEALYRRFEIAPPAPLEDLATILLALGFGMTLEDSITSTPVPMETRVDGLGRLLGFPPESA